MKLLRALLPLVLLSPVALAQNTWYVDDDGNAPGSGSQSDPYTSIQYAIEQSSTQEGDTLMVAPGTYTENIDFQRKALHVMGSSATDRPIIETNSTGGPPVFLVEHTYDQVVVLSQLDIRGYDGVDGGAIKALHSTVVVDDCELGGYADLGGIAYADHSNLQFSKCTFHDFFAWDGGCIYAVDSEVSITESTAYGEDCEWCENAHRGGVIFALNSVVNLEFLTVSKMWVIDFGSVAYCVGGTLNVVESTFEDNDTFDYSGNFSLIDCDAYFLHCEFIRADSGYGTGGAIRSRVGDVHVAKCEFVDCVSAQGGAIAIRSGRATIEDSLFLDNLSIQFGYYESGKGGAIHTGVSCYSDDIPSVKITDCIFVGNRSGGNDGGDCGISDPEGGAVFGPALMTRCTIVGNQSLYLDGGTSFAGGTSGATLEDCIVYGNLPYDVEATDDVRFSLVGTGHPGEGNITGDPLFAGAPDDLTLLAGSPCIDAGNPESPADPDGSRADMGALPYTWLPIGTVYCTANTHSGGTSGAIAATGSDILGDAWLRLSGSSLPTREFGYFLMSASQDFIPLFGGSEGNLCLGAPQYRLNRAAKGEVLYTGDSGTTELRPDLGDLPGELQFHPGQTWNFQLWFRDEASGKQTSNTTDAVSLTWQ